ncbi:ATP-binding protein [Rhizobium sp. P32RR-XVIII]|nr:ATP-binding protein [Rhizobium sp. P32RR-XVIII]
MQIAESTTVPSPHPESNPVIGVLSDEIVVLAEHGGVAVGPGRGFSTFVRPVRHSSRQGSPARTRSVEIPLIGSDGEISGVLCREIPLAERANPVADSELQRLQEIDEVAKVFVHDINNVLSVIGGGLRLLECQGDAVAREVIFERMYRAVERGARLSRSLLDAGRHPCPSAREFASQAHLTAAAETLGHALGERTRLEVEISPDLWEFSADPEQLFFALLNLCRNADAAMSCGGVVSIIATNVDPLPAAPRGAVVITVADNGSGMSEDVLSRAFEPYYTTKAAGDGTGLGLPQVRKFVEQHGGAIRLESEPGVGTTVRMVFPRVSSEARNDSPIVGSDACPNAGTRQLTIGYVPSHSGGTFVLTGSDAEII